VNSFESHLIIGMEDKRPQQLYREVYFKLTGDDVSDAEAHKQLKAYLTNEDTADERPLVVLVLDEIDAVVRMRGQQKALYDLFDLACNKAAKMFIIGISNDIRVPRQLIDKNNSRSESFQEVVFSPYTKDECEQILRERLGPLLEQTFASDALKFLVDIPVVKGDVRKLLQLARWAVDIADSKQVQISVVKEAVAKLKSHPAEGAVKNFGWSSQMFLYSLLSEKVMVQQGEGTHITLPNIARRMSELANTCTNNELFSGDDELKYGEALNAALRLKSQNFITLYDRPPEPLDDADDGAQDDDMPPVAAAGAGRKTISSGSGSGGSGGGGGQRKPRGEVPPAVRVDREEAPELLYVDLSRAAQEVLPAILDKLEEGKLFEGVKAIRDALQVLPMTD